MMAFFLVYACEPINFQFEFNRNQFPHSFFSLSCFPSNPFVFKIKCIFHFPPRINCMNCCWYRIAWISSQNNGISGQEKTKTELKREKLFLDHFDYFVTNKKVHFAIIYLKWEHFVVWAYVLHSLLGIWII